MAPNVIGMFKMECTRKFAEITTLYVPGHLSSAGIPCIPNSQSMLKIQKVWTICTFSRHIIWNDLIKLDFHLENFSTMICQKAKCLEADKFPPPFLIVFLFIFKVTFLCLHVCRLIRFLFSSKLVTASDKLFLICYMFMIT